jgi:hypothetical protein
VIPDPATADRRRASRRRRVGDLVCLVCGEDRPEVIHLHHPITDAIDPEAVGPRCLNHHRLADLAREDAGLRARAVPTTWPERIVAADRALAAEMELLAAGLRDRAAWLERFLLSLDGDGIEWRRLPGVTP